MVGGFINPYRWVSGDQAVNGTFMGTYKYVRRNSGVNSLSKSKTNISDNGVACCSKISNPCKVYATYSKRPTTCNAIPASFVSNAHHKLINKSSFDQTDYYHGPPRCSFSSRMYIASKKTLYKYIRRKSDVVCDTTRVFNKNTQSISVNTQTDLSKCSSKDDIRKLQKKFIFCNDKSRFKYYKRNHEFKKLNFSNSEHPKGITDLSVKKSRLVPSHITGSTCNRINAYRSMKLLKYKRKPICQVYSRTGKCPSKSACRFLHDANYLRICSRYLQHSCKLGSGLCPFAHVLDPCRIPQCTFYEEGKCERSDCPYLHINHPPKTPVCANFARGRCARGRSCTKRHIWASNTLRKKIIDRKPTDDASVSLATDQLANSDESVIESKTKSVHFLSTEVPQGSLRHVFPAPEFIPLNLDK